MLDKVWSAKRTNKAQKNYRCAATNTTIKKGQPYIGAYGERDGKPSRDCYHVGKEPANVRAKMR